MCRKRRSMFSTTPEFNILPQGGLSEENARRAKEMMQSLMGASIFRQKSLPNDNRKAQARAEISDLRPLVPSQLHSTHDRLLLLKRPHEFCTKVPNNLHVEHSSTLEKRQLAFACRFAAWCQSDPAT